MSNCEETSNQGITQATKCGIEGLVIVNEGIHGNVKEGVR